MADTTVIQPQVLLFNIKNDERGQTVRAYLEQEGIKVSEAGLTDHLRLLGDLFGIPGFTGNGAQNSDNAAPFCDEMLIMCAFDREMLDAFLRFFRERGLKPVALKAMLTPVNMNWTPQQLHEALAEEHAMMHQSRGT